VGCVARGRGSAGTDRVAAQLHHQRCGACGLLLAVLARLPGRGEGQAYGRQGRGTRPFAGANVSPATLPARASSNCSAQKPTLSRRSTHASMNQSCMGSTVACCKIPVRFVQTSALTCSCGRKRPLLAWRGQGIGCLARYKVCVLQDAGATRMWQHTVQR
jgi:hypothetical protein